MLRVLRGEECLVIYSLVASFKAEKSKVNVNDAWFRLSPLSLSLSLPQSWSSSLLVVGLLSRNSSFISFFSSYRIKLGFLCLFFLPRRSQIGRKITFNHFNFLTNSSTFRYAPNWCSETLFLHFEESLSTDNIWWLLSWLLVAIIILSVR